MTTYYVDNTIPTSSDLNTGLSPGKAFETLAALSAITLAPGDTVALKSGTHYTGGLTVTASGTAAAPITYTTYGGATSASIANEGLWSNGVSFKGASYVTFSGISITAAHQAGFYIDGNSSHVTVQGADITNVGEGFLIEGSNNLVTHNYVHDLHMVVNTPAPTSDDYGANGVVISGVNNVISDNMILRAKATSYDWGTDGGAFELFGTVDGTQIIDNWVQDSQGMIEVGGQPGHAYNVTINHNVSYNNGGFAVLHNSGGEFGAQFSNFTVDRNTIVETKNTTTSPSELFLEGPATPNSISFTNNIVWMNAGDSVFKVVGNYHSGNIFNLLSSSTHLYNNWDNTLGTGEALGDPAFANLAALQLQPSATGIAAGKGADPTDGGLPVPTAAMLVPQPPNWTDLLIPATPNEPPTQTPLILGHDVAVTHNSVLSISKLFSIADATRTAVKYQFIDWNQNGHLLLNGAPQTHGEPVEVDAAHLSSVSLYAGVGTDSIQVLAFDGTYWSGATVTVTGTNTPPHLTLTQPSGIVGQSVPLSSIISVADQENDATAFLEIVDWNDQPTSGHFVVDGAVVAPSTPTRLTPAQLATATYVFGSTADNLQVRATDGIAWSDFSDVTTQPISPIVTQPIANQSVNTGSAFTLSVATAFQDRNPGGSLTFTAALANGGNLPAWLTFKNGLFSGTPAPADSNAILDITVSAADQGSASTHFLLTVAAPPAPTVQAVNVKPASNSTVSASSLFTTTSASQIVTYEFVDWWNTPTSGKFALSGVAQPQGSDLQVAAVDLSKLTFLAGSTHDFLGVRVYDGATWSTWATFNVDPTASNAPPVIATPIPDQTGTVGSAFNLDVKADFSDPNPGDTLNLTATLASGGALPSWLHFNNGVFSGTPASGDVGTLQIKVTAADPLQASVSDTFALAVAAGNQAPVVSAHIGPQTVKAGTPFNLSVASDFSDPNAGDVLTFSASLANGAALPSWLHFTNGSFSGTPGNGDLGALQIKVTATDPALASVSDSFTLSVSAAQTVPGPVVVVADLKPATNATITPAQLFSASDATGTIQLYEIVDWWNTPTSGFFKLSGVTQPQGSDLQVAASDLSKLTFVAGTTHDYLGVRAFDGTSWSSWGAFNVDPQAGSNAPPVVATPIGAQAAKAGNAFSLNVTADFTDPNPGDALTLTAALTSGSALPAWLHFTNGIFTGTPTSGDVGTLQIKVTATDPSQASASDSFALTVSAAQQTGVPTVTVGDLKPAKNAVLTATQLFSATGAIQSYEIIDWWNVPTSGRLALSGVAQAQETDLVVAAADLGKLTFLAGTSHDYIGVRVSDGTSWSAWASFNIDPT